MQQRYSIIFAAVASAFLVMSTPADAKLKKPKIKSKDYSFGKPTQDVTPKEAKETVRSDGKTSVVTGRVRDAKGKIIGQHSHSVMKDGIVEYSRTMSGRVVMDSKKSEK